MHRAVRVTYLREMVAWRAPPSSHSYSQRRFALNSQSGIATSNGGMAHATIIAFFLAEALLLSYKSGIATSDGGMVHATIVFSKFPPELLERN